MKNKRLSNHHKKLISNTIMLYILVASNYILYFITIPYQTRVLGPSIFGKISLAFAAVSIIQLIMEYGFMTSSTAEASKNRDDKNKLSHIFSVTTFSKISLSLVSLVVLLLYVLTNDGLRTDLLLYVLYFMSSFFTTLIPDYIYRGIENMRIIAIRTVVIRALAALMVFVFMKEKSQYLIIPASLLIGNFIALVFSINDMRRLGIGFKKVKIFYVINSLKKGFMFFISRVSASIYTTFNTVMLSVVYGKGALVIGYYAAVDRLIVAGKQAITPVVDSIYPYMVKNKDYRLLDRLLIFGTIFIAIVSSIIWIFSYDIVSFIFGRQYESAGLYLRLLLPIVVMALPGMLLGYPSLVPLGKEKFANISSVFGAFMHILLILSLLVTNNLNAISLCIITLITEFSIIIFRLISVIYSRKLSKVC